MRDDAIRVQAGRQSRDWTEYDGNLSELSIDFTTDAISPTRLQSWATCPFQYFLASELKLHGLEEPDNELMISPMERGSIVHQILERFTSTRRSDSEQVTALSVNKQFELLETKNNENWHKEEPGSLGRD